jgi:ABC-2 type transport system ATP-binding protein
MKLVVGMLRPSLGEVTVCGVSPRRHPGILRRVGLCPEQDATYPGIAVLDVVAYLTRLQGFAADEARARARSALEHVGLGEVLGRSAAGFSKGMRQRAKLAQALAHDPDVLVLDEPLNGLDPRGRREMGRVIRDLGADGRCVVVSSHILHEVEGLADRVLLLQNGRVLAEGTVGEIRRELPEHPLTIRISTPSAADLARRLLLLEGVRRVDLDDGALSVVTSRPDAVFDRVAAVVEEGLEVTAIEPADEDLEAVFRYLTR